MIVGGGNMSADAIAHALGGREVGGRRTARCPSHDDRTSNFSTQKVSDGRALICRLGVMQNILIATLRHRGGMTIAALHKRYLERWPTEHRRSVRNSMARTLRGLEKLGKVRRDEVWRSTEVDEGRRNTAYHEAGHAVIGMAVGLPIAYACIEPDSYGARGSVSNARPAQPVGPVYKTVRKTTRRGKRTYEYQDLVKVADLSDVDAFGNPYRKRKLTPKQHHGEVIMCIAGGMVEAKHQGHGCEQWRKHASSRDMSIARHHLSKLGDKAKSSDQYEQDTAALINKHWPQVEAVAARLMKVDFVGGDEIDGICRRVVRRQHLKGATG
jgi:hypothetical protein